MRLAREPQAGQAALEHALRALTLVVCTHHGRRQARDERDASSHELIALSQAALWLAVQAALEGEEEASALFPSLQQWPAPRRAELLIDVGRLTLLARGTAREHQAVHASGRAEPSRALATELGASTIPEDEVGLVLTKAAHAAGLLELAAWVCGADALDELQLSLSGLLASVGVLELRAPLSTAQAATFATLVRRERIHWSGPAPKLGAQPAQLADEPVEAALSAEPSGPHILAGRPAPARAEGRTDPGPRERRLVLGASLGLLALLALAVLTWRQSERATRAALRLPSSADAQRASDPFREAAPTQRRVRIYSRPTRAELYLDGRFIGLTPLELERDQANGSLRLLLEGYPELRQDIDLRHSNSSVLVLELGGRAAE